MKLNDLDALSMNYESPIKLFVEKVSEDMSKTLDGAIMEAVHNYRVDVDEEELLKALQYDRQQYFKGYVDGQKSAVKHGHWMYGEFFYPPMCSVCTKRVRTPGYIGDEQFYQENYSHCPNCGATMDEGADDEAD